MSGYRNSQIQSLVYDLATEPLTEIAERIYDLEIERDGLLEKVSELQRERDTLENERDELAYKIEGAAQ